MKTKTLKNSIFRFTRKTFSYPYILFMLIFLVVPLVLVLVNAFLADGKFTFSNFADFFAETSNLVVLGRSILFGVVTTAICLLLGYPVAYFLSKFHQGNKVLVLFFILPMWVNFLLRTLATKALFDSLGIPLGEGTVTFGMVYNYLPFMILPLHTTITNIDKSYEEAARDLGCDNVDVFLKTTLPLSLPGIISGITMVFIPAISTFAISEILSERTVLLFGDSIQYKFTQNAYGVGSVMSLVMLVFVLASNVVLNRFNKGGNTGGSLI